MCTGVNADSADSGLDLPGNRRGLYVLISSVHHPLSHRSDLANKARQAIEQQHPQRLCTVATLQGADATSKLATLPIPFTAPCSTADEVVKTSGGSSITSTTRTLIADLPPLITTTLMSALKPHGIRLETSVMVTLRSTPHSFASSSAPIAFR